MTSYYTKLKKNISRKIIKYKLSKDRKFLIRKGMEKSKKGGLELNIGAKEIFTPNEKRGRIYLPSTNRGDINIGELIKLIMYDYPEEAERYFENLKKLDEY